MKATQFLHNLGQSLWLDNITRDLLDTGTLRRYADELSVTGLTSNPTIFDHAIGNRAAYDSAIRENGGTAKSGEALFFDLALADLTRAADLFRPIRDRTNGVDGWVSLEVSPLLAHDTARTIRAAKDLFARAARPNLLIKIPGTKEGLPAVEEAICAGIPVNVTLLFSREQYLAAAEAFLRGIERRIDAGLNPEIGSVASLFISRWDVAVMGKAAVESRNQLGIAIAKRTYKAYRSLPGLPRWAARLQPWRPPAASPLGQRRDQGPQSLRHPLHQGSGRAFHGEHHAGGHVESARRAHRCRCSPQTAAIAKRYWAASQRPASTSGGRREVIRQVLERPHGRACLQERRSRRARA
jgi:transaldolase